MRGYKKYFYYLTKNQSITFFVVSLPYKYSAHYIPENGYSSKKNCHGFPCPFCQQGHSIRNGLYVIILDDHGQLYYFDISAGMYRELSKKAKEHCSKTGEQFVDMGAFLSNKMVTLTKNAEFDKFTGYSIAYKDVDQESMDKIYQRLHDTSTKLGKKYEQMMVGFPELVRPGTIEEDRDVVYAVV